MSSTGEMGPGPAITVTGAAVIPGGGAVTAGNAAQTWTERRGVLLRLTDELGHVGWGEASPLPGFSRDSLDQCRGELEQLDWPDEAIDVPRAWHLAERVASPAARFAAESALFDLLGQRVGRPMAALLAHHRHERETVVPLNALLGDLDRLQQDAAAAHARGIRAFKIKVGRPERFSDELDALSALRQRYGEDIVLRLDANRIWPPAVAYERLAALAEYAPAYIEEPTYDLRSMIKGGKRPAIPIALDESLVHLDPDADSDEFDSVGPDGPTIKLMHDVMSDLMLRCHVRVLVLKPMLLGGLRACMEWADIARRFRAVPVVSHLLGGPVELAACAQLALAIAGEHACGLDRHAGLAAWPKADLAAVGACAVSWTDVPGLGLTLRSEPGDRESQ
ncbi:MAG: enolase C-terminal domain-like protein [Myxococcota bacterium]